MPNLNALTLDEQDEYLRIREEEYYYDISLKGFVKEFWKTLEPTTTFIDGWEVDALCEHLTACYNREIRNLIINISPRSLKSTICSVDYPAWVWSKSPSERFITTSYAQNLALRDATRARTVILSDKYQHHYGRVFRLSQSDQNAKEFYQNNRTGSRSSFGVGSSIVGQGGDQLICDDPNNPKKNEGAADRATVNFWLREQWYSRVNDPKTCVRIIIQQRTHENDATGYILAEEFGFDLLKIPFRYKGEKYVTVIGWQDPREEYDELMNPNRFSEDDARSWEKVLGTAAAGQLQQEPAPKEGGMFDPSKVYPQNIIEKDQIPNNLILARYWDKAFTEGGGAFTAGVLIGKDFKTRNWYVLDVVRGQWEPTFRDKMILETAKRDKELYSKVRIYLEQEPGSAGRDSVKALINSVLIGFSVRADPATGSKVTRAEGYSSQWGAGNVYLLRGDWNADYINELSLFPNGKFKDQVDASSGGFNVVMKLRVL